jgi:malate synthase
LQIYSYFIIINFIYRFINKQYYYLLNLPQNKLIKMEITTSTKIAQTILGPMPNHYYEILTNDALEFISKLHIQFNDRRKELLKLRKERQQELDKGVFPDFLEETKEIREGDWIVAPTPNDLQDRRVEITGPVSRKMVINALNSGAKVFMADFEDSNSPSWKNNIEGQINLRDAINETISFENPKNGKQYRLNEEVATLMVRPRGWHLEEKNLLINGEVISGGILDFGLFFFHNIEALQKKGSATYFYLPKLENHKEAKLWNDIFVFAQKELGIPNGTIKATVLVETIMAVFELNEILYELKDHSAGLNCGRWDYIFSYIKRFRKHPSFMLPDRDQVGMTTPFMASYSNLVVKTCHKRKVHAMGGMAAQIPIKNDEDANNIAIEKVRQDKLREVKNGHDGTWVAHPGLVKVAMDIFNEHMPNPNQIEIKREDVVADAKALIEIPEGTITEAGVRKNINVGILYIESWLRGNGAAAIYNLMEDAATAEISRTQLWQWIKHGATLDDGRTITYGMYEELLPQELMKIREYVGEENYNNGKFETAISLFNQLISEDTLEEFLTLNAYQYL